jgi:hypothetical protein
VPVRAPRGRGAAYRSLWQWPLRSPARLTGCLALLLLVALSVNHALGVLPGRAKHPGLFASVDRPLPAAAPTEADAPSAPAPTRLPPVPELTPEALPLSAAPPAALTVAARWTRAWAHHPAGTTGPAWLDGLRAYTTEEYLGVLSTVDPSNIPASRVVGPPRPLLVAPDSVRVEVPTDAVDLVVLVVDTGTRWQVAGYDRASVAAPAPTPR